MKAIQCIRRTSKRRSGIVVAVAIGSALAFAAPAWACSTSAENTVVSPISGVPGSSVTAHSSGTGLPASGKYNLYFADSAILAAGKVCHHDGVKIGGPKAGTIGKHLGSTPGVIPSNSSLGNGTVCFAVSTNRMIETNDAVFNVT